MTERPDGDGLSLFIDDRADRRPAGPSVFGAPADGDVLDRLGAVANDDLGSDFFARPTPGADDQARAAFRDSLIALADLESGAAPAAPVAPVVAAPVVAPVVAAPVVAPVVAAPVASPVVAPIVTAPMTPAPQAPSRLTQEQRDFVLHGPSARMTGAGA